VIVIADSSPLIVLAKLRCFPLLKKIYSHLYISTEVHDEVVIAGAGLPGASEVTESDWIEVKQLQNRAALLTAPSRFRLGAGELSTILLAKELAAEVVLLDDHMARTAARAEALAVQGSVGLLETFYRRGYLPDLRASFQLLLVHNVYIDRRLLDRRLQSFGLRTL
jgi:hypothetical protein